MIIAQISDTHIALDSPDADRRLNDFERTIADINTLDPPPDVIIHTGDVAHNGRVDEYAEAAAILKGALAPVYPMVGNKDDRENLRAAFSNKTDLGDNSKFVAYAIEDYPVRLIALDTFSPDTNKGGFCAERSEQLTAMIEAETTKPVTVFAHHPPFEVPVGPEPFNFQQQEDMTRLRDALQMSGRVRAVFCGHVHRAATGSIGSIPISVMPSVATSLRWGDYPTGMKDCPIYHLHRFDPKWGFSTESRIVGSRAHLAA